MSTATLREVFSFFLLFLLPLFFSLIIIFTNKVSAL
jgi:hypothetical protein